MAAKVQQDSLAAVMSFEEQQLGNTPSSFLRRLCHLGLNQLEYRKEAFVLTQEEQLA
ncbi:hypothetical protein [Streptococcus equi]|uniref:hypothetical protein n=1 Tax=Streptococcus equi TaxID=1336 RepID=UPI001E4F93C6|nr:hypothetical protein [Streptococcus equi]MCD3460345.1 hypothetical protein [Streptococcus equi subsp. zooepidemicus]